MKMNKKEYYTKKILYSLSKIDYAKSRMAGQDSKDVLSKLYFVLMNYKQIDIETIERLTKLSRDDIHYGLDYLNAIGVVDWKGDVKAGNKNVNFKEKQNISQFVKELEAKMKHTEHVKLLKEEEDDEEDDNWVEVKYDKDLIIRVKKSKLMKKLFEK